MNTTRFFEWEWPLYQGLGFEVDADMGAVDNDFYKALATWDPGVARQVSLVRLPSNPLFVLDLVEWETPATYWCMTVWNLNPALTRQTLPAGDKLPITAQSSITC